MSDSTTGGIRGLLNHIEEGVLAFLLAFIREPIVTEDGSLPDSPLP